MKGQSFFHTLFQAAGGTRIDVLQLVLDTQQGRLGLTIATKVVGIGEPAIPTRLVFLGEVTNDIATLVKLTTENRTVISAMLPHARSQRLGPVNEIQMQLSEVQPAAGQIRQQSVTRGLVLAGALMKSENRFAPRFIDA